MKVNSSVGKFLTSLLGALAMMSLASCINIFGFVDKPKGDAQLLDAARACLDRGEYTCARDYYRQISNSYSDIKLNEDSLAILAQNGIFFMADMFEAMGTGNGGPSSILLLAEAAAARGKLDAASQKIAQAVYLSESAIVDPTLRAYSHFISAAAEFSSLLASAVGTDGKLTATDLATAAACKTAVTCATDANCNPPGGTSLINAQGSEVTDMDTETNWDTGPSMVKVKWAAKATNDAINFLVGSGGEGIFSAFGGLAGLTALDPSTTAGARCSRQLLLQTFFP